MNWQYDLAIVGGGLRFLSLLTAFADLLVAECKSSEDENDPVCRVIVFDPSHPAPGAVWNDQGDREFRCNALNPETVLPSPGGCSFRVTSAYELWDNQAETSSYYPPRGSIGTVIRQQRDALIDLLSPRISIQLVVARVEEVRPAGNIWRVKTEFHDYYCRGIIDLTGSGFTGYTVNYGADYPLPLDSIPSNVSVVIGGMGLGAIDVVAALTRGRGGIFSDHGEKLVYMPSGNEPNMVLMSRTNRLRQPAEPRTACPSPRRLPSESTAAFWAAASPEEALRVFTSITGIPDFAQDHLSGIESPDSQIAAFEEESVAVRMEIRSRVEYAVELLARERPMMDHIHQEVLSRVASEFTSGPPLERYREWGALARAGILRFSRGTWGRSSDFVPWRVRAFVGNPGLPFTCPIGFKGSDQKIPVDPQTKRANGFKKWWVAGHASSHPLRGDLPTTANVVEWQNAIQPLAEEVISEIGMVSSSVRM